jgi:hypothetical protein
MTKLKEEDKQLLVEKGIDESQYLKQLEIYNKGLLPINILSAATLENGILKINTEEQAELKASYETDLAQLDVVKFVPASGAATRMFKFLYEFLEHYKPELQSINAYINKEKASDLLNFFTGLDKFPFYQAVIDKLKQQHPNYKILDSNSFRHLFVQCLLDKDGLDLGSYPKGLIPFHHYKNHLATPFQEHLFEAANYASTNKQTSLHFTVSPEHLDKFKSTYDAIKDIISDKTNTSYTINYSFQEPYTDTISVDSHNNPLRDENGKLLFRPGGHGALIENLNSVEADLIFIKNIDNIVVNTFGEEVADYKKVLAGKLLQLQKQAFLYLNLLDKNPDALNLEEVLQFIYQHLNVQVSDEFEKYSLKYQVAYLVEKLNKPIRVCGMVKNEGEPGGGPFWVKHENNTVSLQIVESAQVNKKDKNQMRVFKNSTHFNPVDIVCGVKNYKNEKFDLTQFVDQKTYFIAEKSKSGKKLKALELPGLWNGAMADWNTVFVEVPLITFNPVKTVNDLLKPAHQISRSK